MTQRTKTEIRSERLPGWDHVGCSDLAVGMPWPKTGANIGTMVRVVDAVNACLYLPADARPGNYLKRSSGNTLGPSSDVRVHWTDEGWLDDWDRVVAVELAHDSTPLAELPRLRKGERTLVVMGHESKGVPDEILAEADDVVEIPMLGVGVSLNVVNAAALVAYKLRGLV